MKKSPSASAVLGLLLLLIPLCPPAVAAPEAIEVGPDQKDALPRGKEADGIIGDFLLRNDRVEAVISHNAPRRRANMSTFYGADGITPGCLYDLTLKGENNDQITIFSPANQRGRVSYVRIMDDGAEGEAAIETVTTAANNGGLFKRQEYRLRDGWQGVLIVTTLRNESAAPLKANAADRWTVFRRTGTVADITWGDAIDPADKAGYAYAPAKEGEGLDAPHGDVELEPGETITVSRFLAVGHSPAEAVGEVLAFRGETGKVAGVIKDNNGPVGSASVEVKVEGSAIVAYPDAEGRFSFRLPPGEYTDTVRDIGREVVTQTVKVTAGGEATLEAELPPASAIDFDITGPSGASTPCKVQFIGRDGTASPDLGPHDRAHGCANQYHSAVGKFRVQVPPGKYTLVITRGIEFSHAKLDVEVPPGEVVPSKAQLDRVVETPGWVSTDYHNHSTQSGDNTCGTDDRIINLAAEHIEFAPATEHNRIYDWRPHIERLGLKAELNSITGMELTGGGAHLNAFPLSPVPFTQDHGAPEWEKDPRLNAVKLRGHGGEDPDRWVHINHPDLVENFIDHDHDHHAEGGFVALGQLIDGVETQNFLGTGILAKLPYHIYRNQARQEKVGHVREFVWLQLLNQGQRLRAIAVSDAHSVFGNGVGGWRTYVKSSTDDPAEIDWKEISHNSKHGQMILTTGPYLELTTEDGDIAGAEINAKGKESIKLNVRVQCTDWIDIDRVQVLVNGRQEPGLNFTRTSHPDLFKEGIARFDQAFEVPLKEDSHLIVVAFGENHDLSTGYGASPQGAMRPCAYNNPIYVDVDGDGFKPNGDTLGFDLPTKMPSVEEVKALQEPEA